MVQQLFELHLDRQWQSQRKISYVDLSLTTFLTEDLHSYVLQFLCLVIDLCVKISNLEIELKFCATVKKQLPELLRKVQSQNTQ